jgi:oxygen-independent coproporphyrinogen-3 oxidase
MSLAGIYIHIPFCRARCSYCDFATGTYSGPLAERYVRAVASEIRAFPALENEAPEADTIYFGGGTPSLLSPAQVETILEAVHERFRISARAEVTMEMNPGTLTPEILREFRRLGITRASIRLKTCG